MKAQEVIIGSDGGCGHVTLNRPKAINALNFDMCRTIIAALQSWEFDPEIAAIIIDHSDGRGFCAGGDLRALYENLRDGGSEVLDFFRTEYRLDHLLFTLAKPSVCFMDGIVMGGGAGIAMPCRYRVATESTVFAMPETGIGFFPDVGAGWFLSRLPDRIGQWLALTGARLDGADCLRLGLATHYLPRDELASVKARIQKAPDELEVILSDASVSPPPARIDDLSCRYRHAVRSRPDRRHFRAVERRSIALGKRTIGGDTQEISALLQGGPASACRVPNADPVFRDHAAGISRLLAACPQARFQRGRAGLSSSTRTIAQNGRRHVSKM